MALDRRGKVAPNPRGVVLTTGKGGVDKTTVAVAIALELAQLTWPPPHGETVS